MPCLRRWHEVGIALRRGRGWASWCPTAVVSTVVFVISRLFRPWRQASTWWALAHLVVGIVFGPIYFIVVITLLAVTVGLLPVLPAAIVTGWLLFVVSAAFGRH
jgi:hypothetical protein